MPVEFQVYSLAHAESQPSSEVPHSLSLVTGNEAEDQTDATFWKSDWLDP